ncbi:MAG: transposase [Deltaproteobacteria bacterium]|nr:transposase [Deltaproteobacteria bacterium]
MARRGYPPEFRRRVVELVEGGRKVSEVAAELGGSEQTIYTWRRQARIDAGLEAGNSGPTADGLSLQLAGNDERAQGMGW